jgi:hypothetical protein
MMGMRQVLALGDELGIRPLVAHRHLGPAKLYRRTGQHEQAREHLTTATTTNREMGVTYWLEKLEAENEQASIRAAPGSGAGRGRGC